MLDLLKAAERLAKTVRTGFLAAVENAGFLLDGLCATAETLESPRVCDRCGGRRFDAQGCRWCFREQRFPPGFTCLAPPFECLGCVTTSDCTWSQNSAAVPAAADAAPESEAQDGGSGSEEIDAFPRVPSEPHPNPANDGLRLISDLCGLPHSVIADCLRSIADDLDPPKK